MTAMPEGRGRPVPLSRDTRLALPLCGQGPKQFVPSRLVGVPLAQGQTKEIHAAFVASLESWTGAGEQRTSVVPERETGSKRTRLMETTPFLLTVFPIQSREARCFFTVSTSIFASLQENESTAHARIQTHPTSGRRVSVAHGRLFLPSISQPQKSRFHFTHEITLHMT